MMLTDRTMYDVVWYKTS